MEKIKQATIQKLIEKKQFILYSLIGVSGAGLDFVIFTIAINFLHWDPFLTKILSTSVGITNNFFLNIIFNFKVRDNLKTRFMKFYVIGFFGLGISLFIFWIFITLLGINANIVNLVTIIVVVILQYNLNKTISFKKSE